VRPRLVVLALVALLANGTELTCTVEVVVRS
jgi:hypothetical protein